VAHVRRQVANVLGISHPESIAMDTGFFDLGMDSLTSMELRNKLQSSLKRSLPSSLAFSYSNIQSLTDYLEQKIIMLSSETPEAILNKDFLDIEFSESRFYEDEIDMAVDEAIGQLDRLLQ
jgi:acyl carrier protein